MPEVGGFFYPFFPVFNPNAGKYGPQKIRIGTQAVHIPVFSPYMEICCLSMTVNPETTAHGCLKNLFSKCSGMVRLTLCISQTIIFPKNFPGQFIFPSLISKQILSTLRSFSISFLPVIHRCSVEKVFLKISQNSQKNTCTWVSFNKVAGLRPEACNFIKKETLAQVFSCEFCEIFKNPFFIEQLWWLLLIQAGYFENPLFQRISSLSLNLRFRLIRLIFWVCNNYSNHCLSCFHSYF